MFASDGSFTGVALDYAANDSWDSDGPVLTTDERLMSGIIKFTAAGGTLTFKSLPTGGTFDVYVYCEENGSSGANVAQGAVSVGTATNYISLDASFTGLYSKYVGGTPALPAVGNYALWSGVAPAGDGTITINAVKTSTVNDGIGIAAVQLVQKSGPAFPPNVASCSITQDPVPAKILSSASGAQFSVGTAGPCKIQWRKNGTAIAGATQASYAATTADAGASFTAVVYNNVNTNISAAATLTVYDAARGLSSRFIGRGSDQTLNPGDSAGVLASGNWNNCAPGGSLAGTATQLHSGDGVDVSVELQYSFPDSWSSDGPTVTPNDKMMKGILKVNNTTLHGTITLTHLPPTSTYDIYTYHTENGAGANCDMSETVGSTTYWIQMPASFNEVFTRANSTSPGIYDAANYIQFSGVQPAADGTILISLDRDASGTSDGCGIAGVQLFLVSGPGYTTNAIPVAITSEPSDTFAAVGGIPASFTVGTTGPAHYQWQRNGVDIPGAQSQTYSINATSADNGAQFSVRVYNNINSIQSAQAALTVDAAGAPSLVKGFMTVRRWENIGGNTGPQGIIDLTNAIAAGPPNTVFYESGTYNPQSNPDISNFGAEVVGWVSPTVTGDYDFFIRSDDSSALYLNPNPAGVGMTNALPNIFTDTPIAFVGATCCQGFQEPVTGAYPDQTTATPIHLVAGNLYGFIALEKEGGGNDYVYVAWRQTTNTTTAANLTYVPGANCYTVVNPAGSRAAVTTDPQPVTVVEGRSASFSVGVTTLPTPNLYSVQWLANGAAIAGANATTYKTPATTLADSGKKFKAQVATLAGNLTSAEALLTVLPDTNPPVVLGANAFPGSTKVGLDFDKDLDPVTGSDPTKYTVNGTAPLSVQIRTNVANELSNETNLVQLTVAAPLNADFTVTVNGVKDTKGNVVVNKTYAGKIITLHPQDVGTPASDPAGLDPIFVGSSKNWGDGAYDVNCGGADYYNNADGFYYIWEKKTNNFDVKVRVVNVSPVNQWSAGGLMMRETLTDISREYHLKVVTRADEVSEDAGAHGSNDYELNCRLATGDPSISWPGNGGNGGSRGWGGTVVNTMGPPNYPNAWTRMKRVKTATSDHFYGYGSNDGETWTLIQDVDLNDANHAGFLSIDGVTPAGPWPAITYLGMASTSHNNTTNDATGLPYNVFVAYREYGDMPLLPPTLSATSNPDGSVTLTFVGTLLSSPLVQGVYSPVVGAVSPYKVFPNPAHQPTGFQGAAHQPATFYRVQQ
jgi:hypothetical protein